ncbi:hypothetical protein [Vibrio sinus]|nr:hypothetical protein [Vibrio sinus]
MLRFQAVFGGNAPDNPPIKYQAKYRSFAELAFELINFAAQ